MAPLFKLLNVLAKNFDVNLMKNQVVESIFAPLLKLQRLQYVNLPIGDVTMYLECLSLLSTLLDRNTLRPNTNLFQEDNVQFLVAMSIKHGNTGKTHFLAIFSISNGASDNIFDYFQINVVWRCRWWTDFRIVE